MASPASPACLSTATMPTVLVVDDDVEINELVGEYLGLEGMTYVGAFDGKTALTKFHENLPDAVILDLMLPDVDGYEICRRLASHRATAGIPILVLSCMSQECDRQKALACGAFRFVTKPFFPDDLIGLLRDAFEWKRNLTARPPAGQIELTTAHPFQMYHAINEMIADVFTHSALPDPAVNLMRDGFNVLADWAVGWGKAHQRDPHLLIHYRLNHNSGELAVGGPAEAIDWDVSEIEPAVLADTVFKPPTPVAALSNPRAAAEAGACHAAGWYQFLAKAGVARFEKDSKIGHIRLQRPLKELAGEAAMVPVVTIDGTRMPTRLRQEAGPGKRK